MSLVRFALDFLAASLAANEPTVAGSDYLYDGHRCLSTIFAGVHGAPTPFQEGVPRRHVFGHSLERRRLAELPAVGLGYLVKLPHFPGVIQHPLALRVHQRLGQIEVYPFLGYLGTDLSTPRNPRFFFF